MPKRIVSLVVVSTLVFATAGFAGSLRFHGTGTGNVDRVWIAIDAPARPADVAGDFTLEWWMKAALSDNTAPPCTAGPIGDGAWKTGNVIFDRGIAGTPDFGEYGVAIFGGKIAFGVSTATAGQTLCGAANVADNAWHYVAVTRRAADGQIAIFVDGNADGTAAGPTGDISYRDGRTPADPNDPFLVIGGRKGGTVAYNGSIDEVRLSSSVRYASAFARPSQPFFTDASTVLLFHLEELSGNTIHDESGASGGPSDGRRIVGGAPVAGPEWSTQSPPFAVANNLAIIPVVSGLTSALGIVHAGDGSGRIFIVQQGGQIRIVSGGTVLATPFLDITSKVFCCGERGLLGLAFHPQYATNGFFYIYYTRLPDGAIVIARFSVSSNPNIADSGSELVLKTIDHSQFANHNGGQLAFGPDGYLYAGVGDGGSGGDPNDNGQNINVLLGKILRLDVNAAAPYIPPDNPFVGVAGADEIWSFGLRNPWRFSFDRLTGDLYIGDVGQGLWEEVDFQLAGVSGGQNYGWDVLEGNHCFEDIPTGSCNTFLTGGSVLPIFEYDHGAGKCSLTGGYVFRGRPNSFVNGNYFYGDYCTAEIWRATPNGNGTWTSGQLVADVGSNLTSFGEDEAKNLYFTLGSNLQRITPYTFIDVLPSNPIWPSVEKLVASAVTAGCSPTSYCPLSNVTRAQMAVFMLRAKHGQTYLPPPATGTVFTDVPASYWAARWIEQFYAEGITAGCGGGNFCPDAAVQRDQMAVFLLRAHDGPAYTAPPCSGLFNDVPCPSTYANWVEELYRRGITAGCGTNVYCPADPVTRGSMAVFTAVTFSLP